MKFLTINTNTKENVHIADKVFIPFGGVRSMSFFLHHPLGKMNFDLE